MFAPPETLVKQNNYSFDELVAKCHRESPEMGPCRLPILGSLEETVSRALHRRSVAGDVGQHACRRRARDNHRAHDHLKADASPEARQQHLEAAKVMQKGKLVHIDGAAHNLHHDELKRTMEVLNEFLATL